MNQNCENCMTHVPRDAAFCPRCGTRLSRTDHHQATRRAMIDQSVAAYENYREAIAEDAGIFNRKLKFFTLFGFLSAICWYFLFDGPLLGVLLVITGSLFPIFLWINENRWLDSDEYYDLPNSVDRNGRHRCIFCGNRGIYVKGEYASDAKYSYCSKCSHPLFSE